MPFEFSRASVPDAGGQKVCLLFVFVVGCVVDNRFSVKEGTEASVGSELSDEADGSDETDGPDVAGLPNLGRSIGAAKDLG